MSTRSFFLISAVFTASVFVASSEPVSAATPEEAAYNSTCLSCHASVSRIAKKVQGADEAAKRAYLDTFLAKHHAPDKEVREKIIQYLVTR